MQIAGSYNLRSRIQSIDLLRGVVMIIMALDHSRDYFHSQAFSGNPLDLNSTTPLLFFTRWITHFCAPAFVFLSGISIYLQTVRKDKKELSFFLLKRGLWLIVIELTIMSFAFTYDISYSLFILQTIWAIGISMIILSVVMWLPFRIIFLTGLVIVFGHNLLDFPEAKHVGNYGLGWSLFHHQNIVPLWNHHSLYIFYPFLPWTGLMLLGFCTGKLYGLEIEKRKRKKILTWLGVGCIFLFIVIRYSNLYGDPSPWSIKSNLLFTFLSYINVTKYPPSLLYMCLTIGPALLALALLEESKNQISKIIIVYGRVPFLYYILHFYILHTICMILYMLRGHTFSQGLHPINSPFNFVNAGEGYRLYIVYIIWIAVVLMLYPICRWFSDYKATHKDWWLSYL